MNRYKGLGFLAKIIICLTFLALLFLAVGQLNNQITTTHTIQSGESLAVIANQYDTTVEAISEANNIDNPNLIQIGQELVIPVELESSPIVTGGESNPFASESQPTSSNAKSDEITSGLGRRWILLLLSTIVGIPILIFFAFNVNWIFPLLILIIAGVGGFLGNTLVLALAAVLFFSVFLFILYKMREAENPFGVFIGVYLLVAILLAAFGFYTENVRIISLSGLVWVVTSCITFGALTYSKHLMEQMNEHPQIIDTILDWLTSSGTRQEDKETIRFFIQIIASFVYTFTLTAISLVVSSTYLLIFLYITYANNQFGDLINLLNDIRFQSLEMTLRQNPYLFFATIGYPLFSFALDVIAQVKRFSKAHDTIVHLGGGFFVFGSFEFFRQILYLTNGALGGKPAFQVSQDLITPLEMVQLVSLAIFPEIQVQQNADFAQAINLLYTSLGNFHFTTLYLVLPTIAFVFAWFILFKKENSETSHKKLAQRSSWRVVAYGLLVFSLAPAVIGYYSANARGWF